MLLLDLEHVAIAPGITAFTPLDFFDYPITHSLVGSLVWAAMRSTSWTATNQVASDTRGSTRLAARPIAMWPRNMSAV
jgi:hypothetical protein